MVGDILQPTHLLFILVVALLVLGPKRLPEVGRTLGTGLRDFKAAINGESHDDPAPRAYVETDTDSAAAHDSDATESEPAGFDLATENMGVPSASDDEPATPTALHQHQLDPQAPAGDLHAPEAIEDLHPPAATDDLRAHDDLEAPVATGEHTESDAVSAPVAAVSSSGFASALASSRQRPADSGEPTADDE
jgi:sec-independent protein translocase protein TatA